jgi:ATP-dependent Clp protease ATP-binding subunit ClpX
MAEEPSCSLCGKPKNEVMQLIAGGRGFICDECVQLCVRIVITEHPEWRDRLDLTPFQRET